MKRWLILEDGTYFEGEGFGASNNVVGEIVFTTSMTGYQETITDQSFNGQIITFTYPMVGNYGINRDDYESIAPTCKAVVVKEHARVASNWRNQMTLDEFLKRKILAPKKADLLASEGVNTEFFSPDSQSPHDTQTFIFLLPARMLWDKGVGEFVQAAKILRSSQDIRFYLLGQSDCQNPQAISREQIMQWENEGLITYLGFVSDVRAIIKASSCVVLPSYREGVSVALLEAMSMAKPIITSNTPGCKEMVVEGYNGFLCEPRDSRSLASCMQKMLSLKHEQLIELGQNSRNIALSRYDRKLTIARYKQILDQALK